MRRGRCLREVVAPGWREGVTAAQVQDFLETSRRTREIYQRRVAVRGWHPALWLPMEQPKSPG